MDNVLTWDENKVSKWLASIGYSAYEKQFKGMLIYTYLACLLIGFLLFGRTRHYRRCACQSRPRDAQGPFNALGWTTYGDTQAYIYPESPLAYTFERVGLCSSK